jgi:hypothetical protein
MVTDYQPSYGLTFFISHNIKTKDIGIKFLSIIYQKAQDYSPEKVDYGKKWKTINSKNFSNVINVWEKVNNLHFRREKKFRSDIALLLGNMQSGNHIVSYWVEEPLFSEIDQTEGFLQMSIALYELLHPLYGFIHQTEDKVERSTVYNEKYGKTAIPVNLNKGIPGIFWANFFGPDFVEMVGKSKLLIAPSFKTIELSDGGILILTSSSPLNPSHLQNRKKQKELYVFLGANMFYPNFQEFTYDFSE